MITFDFEKKDKLRENILNMQREILDRIDRLNNGGCIHFGYFCSKQLCYLGISHKVYFFRQEKLTNMRPCSHVMIYIKDIGYIDGYKILKSPPRGFWHNHRKGFRPDVEELRKLRNRTGWSLDYKKTQNQILSNIIRKHLNGN